VVNTINNFQTIFTNLEKEKDLEKEEEVNAEKEK